MSENRTHKVKYRYDRNWMPLSKSHGEPYIGSESASITQHEAEVRERKGISKDPRQSAELIKYLIEFIKSL